MYGFSSTVPPPPRKSRYESSYTSRSHSDPRISTSRIQIFRRRLLYDGRQKFPSLSQLRGTHIYSCTYTL